MACAAGAGLVLPRHSLGHLVLPPSQRASRARTGRLLDGAVVRGDMARGVVAVAVRMGVLPALDGATAAGAGTGRLPVRISAASGRSRAAGSSVPGDAPDPGWLSHAASVPRTERTSDASPVPLDSVLSLSPRVAGGRVVDRGTRSGLAMALYHAQTADVARRQFRRQHPEGARQRRAPGRQRCHRLRTGAVFRGNVSGCRGGRAYRSASGRRHGAAVFAMRRSRGSDAVPDCGQARGQRPGWFEKGS